MRTLLAECRPPEAPLGDIKLRLGFVGADATGLCAIKRAIRSEIAEISAIVDESPEFALQATRICPGAAVFSSLDDLLEVGVDGVVIATPGALDVAKAVTAFERGVALYFQRTPDWSVEQHFKLNTAGQTTGFAIEENLFFALRYLRSILEPAAFVCKPPRHDRRWTTAAEWSSKQTLSLAMDACQNFSDNAEKKPEPSHELADRNPNRPAFAFESPCLSSS